MPTWFAYLLLFAVGALFGRWLLHSDVARHLELELLGPLREVLHAPRKMTGPAWSRWAMGEVGRLLDVEDEVSRRKAALRELHLDMDAAHCPGTNRPIEDRVRLLWEQRNALECQLTSVADEVAPEAPPGWFATDQASGRRWEDYRMGVHALRDRFIRDRAPSGCGDAELLRQVHLALGGADTVRMPIIRETVATVARVHREQALADGQEIAALLERAETAEARVRALEGRLESAGDEVREADRRLDEEVDARARAEATSLHRFRLAEEQAERAEQERARADAATARAELAEHNLESVSRRERMTLAALTAAGVPEAVEWRPGFRSYFPDDRVRHLARRAVRAEVDAAFRLEVLERVGRHTPECDQVPDLCLESCGFERATVAEHPGAEWLARIEQAGARACQLTEEVEAWKLASGLERGGDPDGVRPADLEKQLARRLAEAEAFVDRVSRALEVDATAPVLIFTSMNAGGQGREANAFELAAAVRAHALGEQAQPVPLGRIVPLEQVGAEVYVEVLDATGDAASAEDISSGVVRRLGRPVEEERRCRCTGAGYAINMREGEEREPRYCPGCGGVLNAFNPAPIEQGPVVADGGRWRHPNPLNGRPAVAFTRAHAIEDDMPGLPELTLPDPGMCVCGRLGTEHNAQRQVWIKGEGLLCAGFQPATEAAPVMLKLEPGKCLGEPCQKGHPTVGGHLMECPAGSMVMTFPPDTTAVPMAVVPSGLLATYENALRSIAEDTTLPARQVVAIARAALEGQASAAVEDCPGLGQCHGSMSHCARCGDVSLLCNMEGRCDLHMARWGERMVEKYRAAREWWERGAEASRGVLFRWLGEQRKRFFNNGALRDFEQVVADLIYVPRVEAPREALGGGEPAGEARLARAWMWASEARELLDVIGSHREGIGSDLAAWARRLTSRHTWLKDSPLKLDVQPSTRHARDAVAIPLPVRDGKIIAPAQPSQDFVPEEWALDDCGADGMRVVWKADRAAAWVEGDNRLGEVFYLPSDYEPRAWRPASEMPSWAARPRAAAEPEEGCENEPPTSAAPYFQRIWGALNFLWAHHPGTHPVASDVLHLERMMAALVQHEWATAAWVDFARTHSEALWRNLWDARAALMGFKASKKRDRLIAKLTENITAAQSQHMAITYGGQPVHVETLAEEVEKMRRCIDGIDAMLAEACGPGPIPATRRQRVDLLAEARKRVRQEQLETGAGVLVFPVWPSQVQDLGTTQELTVRVAGKRLRVLGDGEDRASRSLLTYLFTCPELELRVVQEGTASGVVREAARALMAGKAGQG